MKNKLFISCSGWMTLTGLILGTTPAFAQPTITLESVSEVAALNADANYGPPPSATFQNPAPGSPVGPPVSEPNPMAYLE
jgi:hypothetical protein